MSLSVYIFLFEANMDVKLNNDFNFIKVDYYFFVIIIIKAKGDILGGGLKEN